MTPGASILLIAVGAILRYAVTSTISGISLQTVGLILMIAGLLGLVVWLLFVFSRRPPAGGVVRDRVVERDPYDPNI
jgi:hypothetical protein